MNVCIATLILNWLTLRLVVKRSESNTVCDQISSTSRTVTEQANSVTKSKVSPVEKDVQGKKNYISEWNSELYFGSFS